MLLFFSGCATPPEPQPVSPEPGTIDAVTKASPLWLHTEDDIPGSSIQVITAHQVRQKQLRQEDMLLVDVRSKDSFVQSHIQGAISLPLAELEQRYTQLSQDKEIILYCGGIDCPLSKTAAKRLLRLGLWNVKDMQEGISGWENQGFPSVTGLE